MKWTRLTLAALLSVLFMFGTAQSAFANDSLNCDDFDTQSEAQAHFDEQDGDPDDLDRDGDGIACESLPQGDATSSNDDASENADKTEEASEDVSTAESASSEEGTSSDDVATTDESTSTDEEGGELPDTSTALPLGILGGLGAMALGALGLRKRQ
ncbi:excalibur calcium-binding domain-containing protein [Lentibacillus sp. CBA3610]|uniref:excalibur calcium-binding domain-containing protein n=1 Tax=Lentibacillus sp. CBA3610 TaxID=2518176 RepID=UPI00159554E8|nr:excalibur calcium-binding domain-containing protein [Lentibacillus sp. CBA3610]QKY70226.1 hypothetical protein Len3610_12025 [Lentibacillus sp. CBA3610]